MSGQSHPHGTILRSPDDPERLVAVTEDGREVASVEVVDDSLEDELRLMLGAVLTLIAA